MTSPRDSEFPASRDLKRGHGAGIAAAVAVAFVLVALLLLPGFFAAGLSRKSGWVMSSNGVLDLHHDDFRVGPVPATLHAGLIVLAPADWLMSHSQTVSRFYNWEYRMAGGLNDSWMR